MPQLDVCSFLNQVVWLTFLFTTLVSLFYSILFSPYAAVGWSRILIRRLFRFCIKRSQAVPSPLLSDSFATPMLEYSWVRSRFVQTYTRNRWVRILARLYYSSVVYIGLRRL